MSLLNGVNGIMTEAQRIMSCGEFMRVGSVLSNGKSAVREQIQDMTHEEIKKIIAKLESNKELAGEDVEFIKLWIVGDAQSYTRMENNLQDWIREFERLRALLAGYENKNTELNDLFELHGILEDGARVAFDIANFLEKKERITQFEEAIRDLASLDREMLAKVLKSKLKSPDM